MIVIGKPTWPEAEEFFAIAAIALTTEYPQLSSIHFKAMLRNWATRLVSKQLRSRASSQSGSCFPKNHNYFKHQSHCW
jgi:hypothetical protein